MRALALLLSLLALGCDDGAAGLIANPGEDRDALVGEPLAFDGSASSGAIDTWSWDFGDGKKGSGQAVNHTYEKPGDFEATLSVSNADGASASKTVAIHVACGAKAVLEVVSNVYEPGQPIQFDASKSAGCAAAAISRFDWDFGDGQKESGADKAKVTHVFATKGTYSLVLSVVDAEGFEGRASRTLNVGINAAKPTITCPATVNATLNKPQSFTAQASDPGGGTIQTIEWTFSDGGTKVTGGTVSHTFAAAGSFTAKVVATTVDGRQSDTCTTNVTVAAPLDYSGNWLLNPTNTSMSGCPFAMGFPATNLALVHAGVNLSATPTGNGWPAGNDLTGTEDPPPDPPGNFRIRATLADEAKTSCGTGTPQHSVTVKFSSATAASGTWRVTWDFGCAQASCATCQCTATGAFTAVKR